MDLAVRAKDLEIRWRLTVGFRFPPGPLNREGKRWDSIVTAKLSKGLASWKNSGPTGQQRQFSKETI